MIRFFSLTSSYRKKGIGEPIYTKTPERDLHCNVDTLHTAGRYGARQMDAQLYRRLDDTNGFGFLRWNGMLVSTHGHVTGA